MTMTSAEDLQKVSTLPSFEPDESGRLLARLLLEKSGYDNNKIANGPIVCVNLASYGEESPMESILKGGVGIPLGDLEQDDALAKHLEEILNNKNNEGGDVYAQIIFPDGSMKPLGYTGIHSGELNGQTAEKFAEAFKESVKDIPSDCPSASEYHEKFAVSAGKAIKQKI